jgi:hypothetical protein
MTDINPDFEGGTDGSPVEQQTPNEQNPNNDNVGQPAVGPSADEINEPHVVPEEQHNNMGGQPTTDESNDPEPDTRDVQRTVET